mmetsp:Transcript_3808/g.5902  ORF Transcript_3808/g.5902 Transcript_3808/m.5902 type:complete len:458 (+) Transcript_3808:46-1419(+)
MARGKAASRRGSIKASKKTASKKTSSSKTPKKTFDKETMKELDKALKKFANKLKVEIFEVTDENAEEIHGELRKGGRARHLTKGKVRTEFMYNYFSCKHGSFLAGSTKLDNSPPEDKEYSKSYSKSNFWWNGLRIFALRQKTGDNLLCGFVVMHNAYLSMYPGPDEEHYEVDPIMLAGRKDITKEIGNDRMGSKIWSDVPILCGAGHGDLLIALALVKCGMKKVIVSVADGEDNDAMKALLERWGFDQLKMKHPKSGKPWEDEEGDASFVMYRDELVDTSEILQHIEDAKKAAASTTKKTTKKEKKEDTSAKKKKEALGEKFKEKFKEMKEKSKEKIEKMKDKLAAALKAKDDHLLKLKKQIKDRDNTISDLKNKLKSMSKLQKASKSKILSLVRTSYEQILGDELPKKKKSDDEDENMDEDEEEEEEPPKKSKKRKTAAEKKKASSSAKRRRKSRK